MAEQKSPPQNIGRFRVEDRLGKGGMGEVYRGYDTHLDRPVALKRIIPEAAELDIAVRRFRREARAVARLGHSAIVQLFDWLEHEDSYWIVMEWIAGPTLHEVLADGPLPWPLAARVACDIANGLSAAHSAGIVHRDLKPANIMLTAHDEIRIMDFGLAKQVGVSEQTPLSAVSEMGIVIGTVTAMSPEQAQGRPVDFRSDLFSFGSLVYQLLTGAKPFRAESAVKVLIRICTVDPPALNTRVRDIPKPLSDLVMQLLEKDPDRRPATARDVADAMEEFAGPRSIMRGLASGQQVDAVDVKSAAPRRTRTRTYGTRVVPPAQQSPDGYEDAGPDPAGEVTSLAGDSGELDPRLEVTGGVTFTGYANEYTRPSGLHAPPLTGGGQSKEPPADDSGSQDGPVDE